MNDNEPLGVRYLVTVAVWLVILCVAALAFTGCTSSYHSNGDVSYSIADGNGGSYGTTLFNPLRDIVPDRHIAGGRRDYSYSPSAEPTYYERPTVREGAIIEWDDTLHCWVVRR